jgi:hypothetical protein
VKSEVWKWVRDYEGLYLVSDEGRIMNRFGKLLRPNKGTKRYFGVVLYKDKKPKSHLVHRLVAEAFHENESNLPQVNHKDGDPNNNFASNLEWVSAKDNTLHRCRVLKRGVGSSTKASKISEQDVFEIRHLLSLGLQQKSVAELFNVSRDIVHCIKQGRTWAWLSQVDDPNNKKEQDDQIEV